MNGVSKAVLAGVIALASAPAFAGGAWVPAPGHGYAWVGFSRKTAGSSWDPQGNGYENANATTGVVSWHDFRYLYLAAEVGIVKNLSVVISPTWLYGLEGPKDDYEKNVGLSDAWFGFKYQVTGGAYPMSIGATHRTPYFYDLPGPYNRTLYNANGTVKGVSPEWRGLLKHDYSLGYLASHSFHQHRAWWNGAIGYTWRSGAPADQVFAAADVGYPIRFLDMRLKAASYLEISTGNDTQRQPDDRFGSSARNNFNNASYWKLGGSAIVPIGSSSWAVELGYNQWLWGHSARQYKEPYISVGRSF